MGGVLRAITGEAFASHFGGSAVQEVWGVALTMLDKLLHRVSLEFSTDWSDALRYAVGKRSFTLVAPLADLVLKHVRQVCSVVDSGQDKATTMMERDDYSTQAKWIRLFQAVFMELVVTTTKDDDVTTPTVGPDMTSSLTHVAQVARLRSELTGVLVNVVDHPYKVCREMIGQSLFVLLSYGGYSNSDDEAVTATLRRLCT